MVSDVIASRNIKNMYGIYPRAIMYGCGFLSCRGSQELMYTHPGLSVPLHFHMLMCPLVRPTPPPSS